MIKGDLILLFLTMSLLETYKETSRQERRKETRKSNLGTNNSYCAGKPLTESSRVCYNLQSSSSPIRRLTSFSFFSLPIKAMAHLLSCNCLSFHEWMLSEILIFPLIFYPETSSKQFLQLDWSPAAGLHKAIAAIFNFLSFSGLSKVCVVSENEGGGTAV